MKTSSKVLIGLMVALVLVLPLVSSTLAADTSGGKPNQSWRDRLLQLIAWLRSQQGNLATARWFFSGAEYVTIEGSVTAHSRSILIVTSGEKRVNVVLSPMWNVNSKVINISAIFEEGYIGIGDSITIKALQRSVKNEKEVTVTIIMAYENIDNTNGNHLYAVSLFNIGG